MTSENKKIKNAKSGEYNGIKFRSQLEIRIAKYLDDNNISYEYEPFRLELLPKFEYNGESLRAVHYTPDFVINNRFLLEVKGFPNNSYALKRKLIMCSLIDRPELLFIEIHSLRELKTFLEKYKDELQNN